MWTRCITNIEFVKRDFIAEKSFSDLAVSLTSPDSDHLSFYKQPFADILQNSFRKNNFENFTGKHLWWKTCLSCLNQATFLKRASNTGVFLWIPFFTEHPLWRLLSVCGTIIFLRLSWDFYNMQWFLITHGSIFFIEAY